MGGLVLLVVVVWVLYQLASFFALLVVGLSVVALMETHTIPPINHWSMPSVIGLCILIAILFRK